MGTSESHVLFVENFSRLLSEDVEDGPEAGFWNEMFSTAITMEDAFEVIGPNHMRQLRRERPANLERLLNRIALTLEVAIGEARKYENGLDVEQTVGPNTALRLLTRIVPFLQESPEDPDLVNILFSCRPVTQPADVQVQSAYPSAPVPSQALQSVVSTIDTPRDEAEKGPGENGQYQFVEPQDAQTAPAEEPVTEQFVVPAIADRILSSLTQFLFLPGYTISEWGSSLTQPNPMGIDTAAMWAGGIGAQASTESSKPSNAHLKARCDVLRCLLTVMSGPLFQSASEYQEFPSRWLMRITDGTNFHTATLFCSLFSTVLSYDPVGWGVPYLGLLKRGSEEEMVDLSLQLLCVLLDYDPEGAREPDTEGVRIVDREEEASERETRNVFRAFLRSRRSPEEIDMMFTGIVRLLSTVHQAEDTVLPGSFRSVGFYQEALVLFWHLVTLNQPFLLRISDHLDTNKVLLPVVYLLQQSQNSSQFAGLFHTASFVLLQLSSERSFAVKLNEPYEHYMPLTLPNFQGCHADVLLLTLYKVISDNLPRAESDALVEMLLTVLCNVSPYIKCFSAESCLKLLSLLERCSKIGYLLRSPFTHHSLVFIMEMLVNTIQYQYEGNAMLVYAILRQRDLFEKISKLEFPKNPPRSPQPDDEPWEPTAEWFASVRKKLPMQPIRCLLDFIGPRVDVLCADSEIVSPDEVVKYLRRETVVGILPVPHSIVIRTYKESGYTAMWFTTYLWGVIFTRSQSMPLYDWKQIRLVQINSL